MALFGSTQSASFQCLYSNSSWGVLGSTYYCLVQNSLNITTLDAAQVDSITGTHLTGFNNSNVEVFQIYSGQIHYFPRGLTNFFKNLKAIHISNTGLKEIHQHDLKDFPKLTHLYLYYSNLEIVEENLFEFNPNLEYIDLWPNKITHIDPNVFDKLTKLKILYFVSNTCININANNVTEVQNLITVARSQCINSDYLYFQQKVKYLEMESEILNLTDLRTKFENLKNEIKNSKYPTFFQERIQGINATLVEKEKENLQDLKMSGFEIKLTNISDTNLMITNNYEDLKTKFTNLINALKNVFNAVV